MRQIIAIVLLLIITHGATAQTDTSKLHQIIQNKIATESFSGIVLIAEKGKSILQVSSGFQDFERKRSIQHHTKFSVASITKMITAIVILELVQENKLQLTDKLSLLLPEYSIPKSDSITVHHL